MKNQSGIYQITSKIKPERFYIGSAVNISERWRLHLQHLKKGDHHSSKLQSHYNKYGLSDLQFSILIGCDKENLIANEQFFIDSYNPWFNMRPKAESNLGMVVSKETREKQRMAKLGKKQSKEHIEKRVKGIGTPWNKGRKATPEAILHQSESHKGKPTWNKGKPGTRKGVKLSEDTIEKMRQAAKGRIISEEQKRKISTALKGRPGHKCSDENKKNISERSKGNKWSLGRIVSNETRKKISESGKGKHNRQLTKEEKERISKSLIGNKRGVGNKNALGYRFSDESKQKMRERLLKEWALKKLEKQIFNQEESLCN